MAKQKPPTPFEMAKAAHEGKIDPKELRGAARYVYETQPKEAIERYISRPADVPLRKGLTPGKRIRRARSH